MNIIINTTDLLNETDVLIENRIQFLNTKRNITMDGEFTKLLFVTEHFSTDSLFLRFPVQLIVDPRITSKSESVKRQMVLNPNSTNQSVITNFTELEKQLLNYYKKYKNINKHSIMLLNNNLLTGNIKLFTSSNNNDKNKKYAIKISGIWESYENIGMTYKIIEVEY